MMDGLDILILSEIFVWQCFTLKTFLNHFKAFQDSNYYINVVSPKRFTYIKPQIFHFLFKVLLCFSLYTI